MKIGDDSGLLVLHWQSGALQLSFAAEEHYHSFMSFPKKEPHINQSICLYLLLYKIVGLQVNSESNVRMEQGVINHKQVRVRQLGLKLSYKV